MTHPLRSADLSSPGCARRQRRVRLVVNTARAATRTACRPTVASVAVVVVVVAVSAVVLLTGAAAWAAPAPTSPVSDLKTVINNITTWVIGIAATIATLFLVIGGARYLMAGGDPSEIERAKAALRSAAIGYGLVLLAPLFLTILNTKILRG